MAQQPGYDVLIIGAGQAAVPLAHALSKAGRRVAIAERKHLGGSCVNFGCTPTKAAFTSARIAHLARRAREFGLQIPTVEVDFPAVLERARKLVLQFREGLEKRVQSGKNIALLRGHARLEGRDGELFRVRVGDELVIARDVVLDTGTRSLIPPIEGLDKVDFIHAGNWLDRSQLPEALAVLGGSYIGLEMAQFYQRMGSRVIVIEEAGQVAGHEDEDVASALQKLLEAEGIQFLLRSRVRRIEARDGVTLVIEGGIIKASQLFVATGRRPNTDDLGLETVGLKPTEKGIIEVDARLATSVPGLWVAGDIRGGPMFTHTSWDDYRILFSQLAGDKSRTTRRVVPYALFTDPELGRVGLTETEARKQGREVKVARFDVGNNGKAKELGETAGFIKVVADASTNQILGAAVLAVEGAELVHLYVDLMNAGAPYTLIRNAVYIHPTLAEAVQSAVSSF